MPLSLSLRLANELAADVEIIAVPHQGADAPQPMVNLGSAAIALDPTQARLAAFDASKVASALLAHAQGAKALLALGAGREGQALSLEDYRQIGASLVRHASKATSVAVTLPSSVSVEEVEALATGALLASYVFNEHRSKPKQITLSRLDLLADPAMHAKALERAEAAAQQVAWARDQVNATPSILPPRVLADRAVAMLEDIAGTQVEVWEQSRIESEKLGGLLGVARGSEEEARLVKASWSPAGATKHVVLVGKGITFDTGGLSLKTAGGMVTMKTDMSGAAIVLAALGLVARLQVPIKVTAIAPMAENMPSGRATKPDDVLVTRDGQTIEVLNTDAEGRLILADGLTLARELEPDYIIDVATLTGAVSVALGREIAAVMGTDATLVEEIIKAGNKVGERFWELPLPDIYESHIESEIADMKNIGKAGEAGTISAALLLKRFVGDIPWAHVDIAGTGRSEASTGYLAKGGTAFSLRSFAELLEVLAS